MNYPNPNPVACLRKVCWLFVLLITVTNSYSAERIAVAVLSPYCESKDTDVTHWQYVAEKFFERPLAVVQSIRVLPKSSIKYGYRESHLEIGQPLTPKQILEFGRAIEAQEVVYCTYEPEGEKFKVKVQVTHVATGKRSTMWIASTGDWPRTGLGMSKRILNYLKIRPSTKELKKMDHTRLRANQALELTSRATAENHRGKPLIASEPLLASALKIDPDFLPALLVMAQIKLFHGQVEEATAMAKKAIELEPNSSGAHQTLGKIYLFKEEPFLARDEFLKAIKFDPDDSESYSQLSTISVRRGKWDEALGYLEKAKLLEPHSGTFRAQLARLHAFQGEREKALAELQSAESLFTDETTDQMMGETYAKLNEIPQSVEHYERFVAETERRGATLPQIDQIKAELAELKARMTPHLLEATVPKEISQQELQEHLSRILGKEEMKLVVFPMSSTPEMRKWARQLVGDAQEETEKAQRIFQGLSRHINLGEGSSQRTAEQTFKDWGDPETRFICQEYTLLYMALARDVGLKAFYVLVTKDYRDRFVPHACAGISVDGKVLLVDPAYKWFGVPHKEYQILNDQQATGFFMCQLENVDKSKVAVKLAPELAVTHFDLAICLVNDKRVPEAVNALNAGLAIDAKSWLAFYSQGIVAAGQQRWDDAIGYIRKSADFNPEFPNVRFYLAKALLLGGKLTEAREEYRSYLLGQTSPKERDEARAAIVAITERLNK